MTGGPVANIAQSILHDAWQKAQSGQVQTLFFHGGGSSIFCELLDDFLPGQTEVDWVKVQLTLDSAITPYAPFLEVFKHLIEQRRINPVELLNQTMLYAPHRKLILDYLSGRLSSRRDEPVRDEWLWEAKQWLDTLRILLLKLACQRPLVLAVADVHLAHESTWSLIQHLAARGGRGNLLVVCSFNRRFHHQEDELNVAWDHFLTSIEQDHTLVEMLEGSSVMEHAWPKLAAADDQRPEAKLREMEQGLLLYAAEESLRLARQIQKDHDEGRRKLSDVQWMRMATVIGDACHLLGEYDEALNHHHRLLELSQSQNRDALVSEASRRLCLSYLYKQDSSTAQHYAQQALKFALVTKDEWQELRSLFVLYLVADKSAVPLDDEQFTRLLHLANKHHQPSILAHCLSNAYIYRDYYQHMNVVLERCQESIQIAKKQGNWFAAAAAYHRLGITHSYIDDYVQALKDLRISKRLRQRLGDTLDIVRINNGLGYFYTLVEDYSRAASHFAASLGHFARIKDYNEITITLFNCAWLAFMARDFRLSVNILEKMIQVMRILKMTQIPYRTLQEIYLFKAVCHVKLGERIKGLSYLQNVEHGERSKNPESLFMQTMLKALVARADKHPTLARRYFDAAVQHLDPEIKIHKRLLPFYYLEYAAFCQEADQLYAEPGMHAWAQALIEQGQEACTAVGFTQHAQWLTVLAQDGEAALVPVSVSGIQINIDYLVDLAHQQVTLNQLHKKIREIKFLNSLQQIFSSNASKENLANEVLSLINANLPIEAGFVHLRVGKHWEKMAAFHPFAEAEFDPQDWVQRLSQEKNPVLQHRQKAEALGSVSVPFNSLINLPIRANNKLYANLLFATVRADLFLTNNDLEVLSIVANQLFTAFERIDRNAELLRMSLTDSLTGLNNRQALNTRLKEELARFTRYRERTQRNVTLGFIDLDNFKTYNDRFGHEVGDLILKTFANLLRHCLREVDFIARIGGDEFVMVLPETTPDEALIPVNRILKRVQESDGFRSVVEESLGCKVELPEGKILTCSIGLAATELETEGALSVDVLLRHADQALYDAKHAGKNSACLWQRGGATPLA